MIDIFGDVAAFWCMCGGVGGGGKRTSVDGLMVNSLKVGWKFTYASGERASGGGDVSVGGGSRGGSKVDGWCRVGRGKGRGLGGGGGLVSGRGLGVS